MARGVSTPWGMAQSSSEKCPGIVFHSTAGHGGFHLAPHLNAVLQSKFEFPTFAGGPWYEEDCDAAAVAIAFPEHFSANSIRGACRAARHFVKHDYGPKWENVVRYIDGNPELLAIEQQEQKRTEKLWERQGLFGGGFCEEYKGYWGVNFSRGEERKTLMLPGYPEQQWYTDDELKGFEDYSSAKHDFKRKPVAQMAHSYSGDFDSPSDADPGL